MAAAGIFFLLDPSQKLFRSPEIHREPSYQMWLQSSLWFTSYHIHKLFGRPSWEMDVFGSVPKKYIGRIALWHRTYNYMKKNNNLAGNFLVRARLRIRHNKHPNIHWGCLNTIIMTKKQGGSSAINDISIFIDLSCVTIIGSRCACVFSPT